MACRGQPCVCSLTPPPTTTITSEHTHMYTQAVIQTHSRVHLITLPPIEPADRRPATSSDRSVSMPERLQQQRILHRAEAQEKPGLGSNKVKPLKKSDFLNRGDLCFCGA